MISKLIYVKEIMFVPVTSIAFILAGTFLLATPPGKLLKHDRRAAYHKYQLVLDETGDEEQALSAASRIYRFLGCAFLVVGLIVFSVSC